MQRRQVTYSQHPNHRARAVHAQGERQFRTYDTSGIRPRKSKAPGIIAAVFAVIVIAVAGVLIFNAIKGCSSDSGAGSEVVVEKDVQVTINDGISASDAALMLQAAGVVPDAKKALDRAKDRGIDSQFKAGTYSFTAGMTLDQVIDLIASGNTINGNLTIPEGYKLADIAAAVETATQGSVTADSFKQAASDASVYASDYSFLESAGSNSLEGFLFPKTYTVTSGATADSIIRMMLGQFASEIANLDFSYPESKGLSLYDTVKLASIVEKESSGDMDIRKSVAGVFYNRLTTPGEPCNGYLQSDATTAYVVGHDPSPEEVHADDPFSTYSNPGLPPTPICSPSLDCLMAACQPTESSYFFFYFEPDADGTMKYHFSETYEEHQSAIAG